MLQNARRGPVLTALALIVPAASVVAQADWQRLRSLDGGSQIAFDAARGRLVRFGEQSSPIQPMEWRGEWLYREPASGPSARAGASFAYDAAHRSVVLFGGSASGNWLADTWSWDGVRWTQANTPVAPTPRTYAMMAFDPLRQRLVLFGGFGPTGPLGPESLGDTWLWDGTAWSRPVLTVEPAARSNAGIAFDRQAGKIVLAGGLGPASPPDMWQWDGVTWQLVGAAPATAAICSLAYDEARSRLVLTAAPIGTAVTTVHEWSGQGWTQIVSGTTTGYVFRLAYNGLLGRVVRHEFNGRLEAWDGVQWQEVDPGEPVLVQSAATANYITGAVHLVGLDGGLTTWRWASRRWARLQHATDPGGDDFMLATDPNRGCMVLSGFAQGTTTNSTWEWHGADWQRVITTVAPPARYSGAMGFDGPGSRVLLFGGFDNGSVLDDTWTYDGTNWTLQQPANHPSARWRSGMATDLYRGRLVLYGGADLTGPLGDTWEWNGSDWQLRTAQGPGPRELPACDFDTVRGRVLLSGGVNAQGPNGTTWAWDGTQWLLAAVATEPFGPATMAFDQVHDRHVMHAYSTSWVFESGARAAATVVGQGCTASLGLLGHGADVPVLESYIDLEVIHAAPGAPCLIAVAGAQQTVSLGGGCTSYLAGPWSDVFVAVANPVGVAQVPILVPDASALMGATAFTQAAALDPAGPFGGVSVANALQLTVGR